MQNVLNAGVVVCLRAVRMVATSLVVCLVVGGLALSYSSADAFLLTLNQGNDALVNGSPSFTGPYGTVQITLIDGHDATVTFTALPQVIGGQTYQYLFGDGSSVALNVNLTGGTVNATGFTWTGGGGNTAFSFGGSGNVDGFGVMNATVNDFDGFTAAVKTLTYTLQLVGGSGWSSDADVVTANASGFEAAAHIFASGGTCNGACVTGFAANGPGGVTPEPSTIALLGFGLVGVGFIGRRIRSQK
jgi:hypothetical protein